MGREGAMLLDSMFNWPTIWAKKMKPLTEPTVKLKSNTSTKRNKRVTGRRSDATKSNNPYLHMLVSGMHV